jgi:hypothetical protein
MENILSPSVIPMSFIDSSKNILLQEVPTAEQNAQPKDLDMRAKTACLESIMKDSPDVKILDGDNKVDVDIEPDVKNNSTNIQLCSCSIILNCFTRNTTSKT